MKKISLLILAMVCAMVTHASESEFTLDELTYEVTSLVNREVSVGSRYTSTGDIVIPPEVISPTSGISYKVTSIRDSGFRGFMTSIVIPNTVRNIGARAFATTDLMTVTIPNSVTCIGERAFEGCYKLTSVTLSNSVAEIPFKCFSQCKALPGIEIPNSVTTIGLNAFYGCVAMKSVTIPATVEYLDPTAFYSCTSMTDIMVEEGNQYYTSEDGVLYSKDMTILYRYPCGKTGTFSVPGTVKTLGDMSFTECVGLTSVTIPNSVTEMGHSVFLDCSSLTSIVIPNSVTSIEDLSFTDCENLVSITLPNNLTTIGPWAFSGCKSMTSIRFPDSLKSLGSYAFAQCSSLRDITIPNSVTSIAERCFSNCTGLVSVKLPESITVIERCIFIGCRNLTSIAIPESVTSIGSDAFTDCRSLTDLLLPTSLISIESLAFSSCRSLVKMQIPATVSNIGDGAFSRCSSLTGIDVDSDNRFYESIDGVLYDKEITKIYCYPAGKAGEYSFPATVNSIAFAAFADSHISALSIPNSVTEIGGGAFSDCSNLASISIPNTITTLNRTFSGCSSLEKIIDFNPEPQEVDWSTFSGLPDNALVYVPQGCSMVYANDPMWKQFFRSNNFREMGEIELSITPGDVTLGQGDMLALQVDIIKDGDVTVDMEEWSSSDPSVATVDGDGNVTGLSVGSATITYTVTDCYGVVQTASCNVNVVDPSGIEDVVIDGNDSCEVFNLQGLFVGDSLKGLTPGIYIVKQGTTTRKVVIK